MFLKKKKKIPTIGKLALQYKLISKENLEKILSAFEEKKSDGDISFQQFMVDQRIITQKNMNSLISLKESLELRQLYKKFAEYVVINSFATREQVDAALNEQNSQFSKHKFCRPVGDILVDEKIITIEQRNLILSKQNRFDLNSNWKRRESNISV